MHIFLLVPDLAYGGAARQACQLARALPRSAFDVTVAALGGATPLAAELRRAGVTVHTLGRGRRFDPVALWRLRALVRALAPAVIHVWRPAALRALGLAVGRPAARLIVSDPLPRGAWRPGLLDRWLLRHAWRLLTGGAAEADRCRRFGLSAEAIEVVCPAVEALASPPPQPSPTRGEGAKSRPPQLVCAGRMVRHKGFRDAIWAFDILHYVAPDLRLHLVGDGPERPALEHFTDRIDMRPVVDFAGAVPDMAEPLAAAEVVWVPSLAPAGVHVALEAQALGRPVVASRLPELAEVVADGETGCLVEPGDKVGLARQTQRLLRDEAARRQLGAAGRARVLRDFPVAELARHVADVYARVA